MAGLPHPDLGESVTLIVEGEAFAPQTKERILESAATLLARYEMPKDLFFVPEFTETPTGKVDRLRTVGLLS